MGTAPHPAFEFLRSEHIDSLNVDVQEYRHRVTGAQHIHIATDNPEKVFLVALRTVPEDSTGVAHILEHTALCGSKKYPVRDPFFMMIRRSLNTFMNAFTSSDWTAYPFASQNRKDFNNLLDVYLDAVFFSRLDELDFAQEGHRIEFAEQGNPESDLVYKGVVFNEMKGAMSSVPSTLWHTLCEHLYPTTTYHHNSGGEPADIPNLSYEELKAFYKTHYHPSNAIFLTYGDLSAAELQKKFEDQALSQFSKLDKIIEVGDEQRLTKPIQVAEHYAFNEEGSTDHKTHIVVGWLLGLATDLEASMEAHLLCSVLLDNSASPLQKLLETTELGHAPSPLCGLDDSQRELCFVCGVEGSEPEHAEAIEQQILAVIQDVAENGIPYEQLEASLHQLEMHQREISGDGYPYGLQIILNALTSATHRGDVIAQLNLDPVLTKLRKLISNTSYIKELASKLLLNNQHRVRLVLQPDTALSAKRDQAEADRLQAIKDNLSNTEKQRVIERAEALAQRQLQEDDESILPKVDLSDIPTEMAYTAVTEHQTSPLPLTSYAAGTNGLLYQQIVLPMPQLSEELIDLLPMYTTCITELGVGDRSYLDTQLWQAGVCGGIGAYVSARGTPDNAQQLSSYLTLSAKGLTRNQSALTELMHNTLEQVRFDELPRIQELVAQTRARREMGVVGSGHSLAMSAASSGLSAGAELGHRWGGLEGIRHIKQLDESLSDSDQLKNLGEQLQTIHNAVLSAPRQWLLVGEQECLGKYQQVINGYPTASSASPLTGFSRPEIHQTFHQQKVRQLWLTNTQVNFCARAYPTVTMNHPDAAALTVLGGFLRNGYLHRSIREQGGAYGGGAGQDSHIAAFRFFSYRDPRLEETLNDFTASLDWLQSHDHSWQQVEEAILGVIGGIDKPGSPAGEAKQTFHAELFGYSRKKREQFRNRVLEVTATDLQRVASCYLTENNCSTAIITNLEHGDTADKLDLTKVSL